MNHLERILTGNLGFYRGASPGTNTEEFVARVERLKDEVRRLDKIEKDMDKHRQVSFIELMKKWREPWLSHVRVEFVLFPVVRTEFKEHNRRTK